MKINTSFVIGGDLRKFVETQVASGRYGSASDVIRSGLRLLEEHERQLVSLQNALAEGEQSGPALPFDFDEFVSQQLVDTRKS